MHIKKLGRNVVIPLALAVTVLTARINLATSTGATVGPVDDISVRSEQKLLSQPLAQPKINRVVATVNVFDRNQTLLLHASVKVQDKDDSGKVNAFDLVRSIFQVDYISYSGNIRADHPMTGGQFLTSIGGIKPDPGTYWALYVDGRFSCDKVITDYEITDKSISIDWKMEEFSLQHPECISPPQK